jgi:hypothetical protein
MGIENLLKENAELRQKILLLQLDLDHKSAILADVNKGLAELAEGFRKYQSIKITGA